MNEPLSAVLDRASAALGDETNAAQRQGRALLVDALLQAQETILGHRKIEPVTIDQMDAIDKFVSNMVLRKGRAITFNKIAERAVADEIVPQAQEAA